MDGITIKNVKFHRNGVQGEGFYAIHFILNGDVAKEYNGKLVGIVIPNDENEPDGRCYVVKPSSSKCKYRGDTYELDLRKAISVYEGVEKQNMLARLPAYQ